MKILFCLAACCCFWKDSVSQDSVQLPFDTVRVLEEVKVNAYAYSRRVLEVPASVAYIEERAFQRFNNTSILPVVNTVPGVRMEERSPGSYRFSIRGSLLRSPFGIRNVKMYWNGLPLTDGGGNTYLNLIDFGAISSMEIIKGPGGSLYGAGTGGVVLLNTPVIKETKVEASAVFGSYGLQRYSISAEGGSEKVKTRVHYAHQEADGYRDHSNMKRDAFNTELQFALSDRSTLSSFLFYTDLSYQTPGGLTEEQFQTDPSQARQIAIDQRAAIYNKTLYAGLSHEYQLNERWSNRTGIFGSYTDFRNPFVFNFEKRYEHNLGGRTDFLYRFLWESATGANLNFGAEAQYFFSPIRVLDNSAGEPGPGRQWFNDLTSRQAFIFAQGEVQFLFDLYVTIGASVNFLTYNYQEHYPETADDKRTFDPVVSPRIALLQKLGQHHSVFTSVSRGFSPPSLAEVRPSANVYNNSLEAEYGTNYEIGWRGSMAPLKFTYEVVGYSFDLDETIVIQRNEQDADYYVNAGSTTQKGLEIALTWHPIQSMNNSLGDLKVWSNYTYNHYRFDQYIFRESDYSDNRLTGVAPHIIAAGLDVVLRNGTYGNVTWTYTDEMPLNDANTTYADDFSLVSIRVGHRFSAADWPVELFAGVDNVLNERYSLGNDLNAAGNRFFNPAAPANFYIGLVAGWKQRQRK